MPLSDLKWNRLLGEIEDRQVLPIVGSEAVTYEADGVRTNFFRLLARELAAKLEIDDQKLPPNYQLEDVVYSYLSTSRPDPDEPYITVREIIEQGAWDTPGALRDLAGITSFDVYVSTTFDGFLERAINEVRFRAVRRTRPFSFCRTSKAQDLPADYQPSYDSGTPSPDVPAVYYLFGKIGPLRDYSLREEDLLQCFHRMHFLGQRPPNLFDLFRTRSLLLLGCGFPGWLTRFFLAAARGDLLFTSGARGIFADSSCPSDRSLVLFLERRQMTVYETGDTLAFIAELRRRWDERNPPLPPGSAPSIPAATRRTKFLFISYAHEDRDIARVMRDDLGAAGIDVWMDEGELEPGDEFKRKILLTIEECTFFLPLITGNVGATKRRFLYREWRKATDERESCPPGYPFIQPILHDTTPAESVPPDFRDVNFDRLENGRLTASFIQLTLRRLSEFGRG